jgi:P-type Ca2+ transporter type 2C
VMRRPPRPPAERVITRRGGLTILFHGGLNAVAAAVAFYAVYRGDPANTAEARTVAFTTLAFAQLAFSFGCRSFRYTLPQLGLLTNRWLIGAIAVSGLLQLAVVTVPFLQPFFQVHPVSFAWEWGMIALLALMPVTVVEVIKLVRGRTAADTGGRFEG